MKISRFLAAGAALSVLAAPALAQQWYVAGSAGIVSQSDSANQGRTGAFTTGNLGNGSTLDVAAGTPYGWTTEFKHGFSVSGEIGARYDRGLRAGVEIAYSKSDVDTHRNVSLAGGSIDGVDAAAIAGSPTPLGVSVADVVADGRGDVASTSLFLNAYYDFNRSGQVQPYLGAGLGVSDFDVTYRPSGIGVIEDGATRFAYQLKAGLTWQAAPAWDLFAEYAYRATEDIDTGNDLFPGNLEIENRQSVVSVGLRYRFGS